MNSIHIDISDNFARYEQIIEIHLHSHLFLKNVILSYFHANRIIHGRKVVKVLRQSDTRTQSHSFETFNAYNFISQL